MKSGVGVLIATYNRPESLDSVLTAVAESDLIPQLVVIADASDEINASKVEEIAEKYKAVLNIRIVRSNRGSLCHQRNLGRQLLAKERLFAIQVLDDDTRPTKSYISGLLQILMDHEDVIGASGVSHDPPLKRPAHSGLKKAVFSLFGLDGYQPGSLTIAGVGLAPKSIGAGIFQADWLFGCSMWRAAYFNSAQYRDELVGSCLFEDVDYSVRASRAGRLVINPNLILEHDLSMIERPDLPLYAYRFSRNRLYVIRNLRQKPVAFCFYTLSVFVLSSMYFARGCFTSDKSLRVENYSASKATIRGYIDALRGKEPK